MEKVLSLTYCSWLRGEARQVPRKRVNSFLIVINTMGTSSSVVARAGSAVGTQTTFPFEVEPPKMSSVMASRPPWPVWQWVLDLAVGVSGARACRGVLVRFLKVTDHDNLD